MHLFGQSRVAIFIAIVATICLGITALPHGKKYRHHVKSRDHLEDDFVKPKRDPWRSSKWTAWDPFKDLDDQSEDFDKKSDSFVDSKDDTKSWDDGITEDVDKETNFKSHAKEIDASFHKEKSYFTRDYSSFSDKTDEKKIESESKKSYSHDVKPPAVPGSSDYLDEKAEFKSKSYEDKKALDVDEKGAGFEDKPKFGHWPIGDDTDKLPHPTTAATKLHPLKLSKPLIRCKSESDCPMSRVCKDSYCHCADKSYCVGHSSPVCGSDGILYPSHCELHRTACIKIVHIKIDHKGLCFEKEKGTDTVGFLPVYKQDRLKKDGDISKEKVKVFDDDKVKAIDEKVKAIDNVKDGMDLKLKSIDDVKDFDEVKEKSYQNKDEVENRKYIDDAIEIDKKSDTEEKKDYDFSDDFNKKDLDFKEKSEQDGKDSFASKENEKSVEEKENSESKEKDDQTKDEKSDDEHSEKKLDVKFVTEKQPVDEKVTFDDSKEYYDDYDGFGYYDNLKTLGNVKDALKKESKDLEYEVCSDDEYRKFKEELLRYHCTKFEEPDCDSEVIEKRKFLASIMFSYYDRNFDDFLQKEELEQIEMKEHFERLSDSCILVDILRFEDTAKDGKLSIEEFFEAFSLDGSMLDERVKTLSLMATVGHGLELTCGIKGADYIIWKRHGVDVNSLHMDDISAFEDGTLYISRVGVHHMGNFSCHDRKNPNVVQTHLIKVQMTPKVKVMPGTQLHQTHTDVTLKCHAEGVPRPKITWEINEVAIPDDVRHFERRNDNHTLVIHDSDYQKDTGAYKCRATNVAGVSQDIATVFIQNYNSSQINSDHIPGDNMFLVFHNKGYNIYEPQRCLVRHEVSSDFTNLKYFPEMMDSVATLCGDSDCDWGMAINVANKFVYVSQPSLSRIVIIDVTDQWNPIQLVDTDKQPMELQYVPHLDQVWVLCWNGGRDSGSKTMVVVRDASKQQRHHIVHTQPVGNRFDLIQNMFLPPANDLGHRFEFGYVVHTGQRGLYKLELEEMKYIKAIDFTKHNCHPKAIVFIPLGGKIVVQCQAETIDTTNHFQLIFDYLSDIVLSNSTLRGHPYVSPDSRYLVTVDGITGEVDVKSVTDEGVLKQEFTLNTGSPLNEVTFHPSSTHKGYDLYLSSRTKGVVYFMDLQKGKLLDVEGVAERVKDSWLWDGMNHALVGSGLFGDYLLTTTDSSVLIIDGKLQNVECEFRDLKNSHVVAWVQPELI